MSNDCGYKCAEESMKPLNKTIQEIVDSYELKDEFIESIRRVEKQPVRKIKINELDELFLEVQEE